MSDLSDLTVTPLLETRMSDLEDIYTRLAFWKQTQVTPGAPCCASRTT